uniref:NAD(P)-binding protein n=1 Tax=Heterorhabditis bacteriophora TaxID=37862 RepID=A0A1I7WRL3_HETBA
MDATPDAKIDLIMCDLSSLQSVQAAAKEYKDKHCYLLCCGTCIMLRPLHALVLNAGVFAPSQKATIDGLETCFGVNHVAHMYLIRELLPLLRQSTPSRIVIVSSTSHNHTGVSGKYWESCWDDEKHLHSEIAHDEKLQDALWIRTDELLDKYEASRIPIKTVSDSDT